MSDYELFREVFGSFQSQYKGLDMYGSLVYHNGECFMNTEGFNLLYNLKRLCDELEDELL